MKKSKHGLSVVERLVRLMKVNPTTQCWEWQAARKGVGYGMITINNKNFPAHRVSYQTFKGPILDGFMVCHECDNRLCINPLHLWLGTDQENRDDMRRKGRARYFGRPFCEPVTP